MAPPALHTKSPACALTTSTVLALSGLALSDMGPSEPHLWRNGQDYVYNLGDGKFPSVHRYSRPVRSHARERQGSRGDLHRREPPGAVGRLREHRRAAAQLAAGYVLLPRRSRRV